MPKLPHQPDSQQAKIPQDSHSAASSQNTEQNSSHPDVATLPVARSGAVRPALTPQHLLALQGTVGNRAVQRMVQQERALRANQALTATATGPEVAGATLERTVTEAEPVARDLTDSPPAAEAADPAPSLSPALVASELRTQVEDEDQTEDRIDAAASGSGLGSVAADVSRPEAVGREVQELGISANPQVAQAQLQAEGIRNPATAVAQEASSPLNQELKQAAEKKGIGQYLADGISWTAEAILTAVALILVLPFALLGNLAMGAWWLLKKIGSGIASGAKAVASAVSGGFHAGVNAFKKNPVGTSFSGVKTGYGLAAEGVKSPQQLQSVGASVSGSSLSAASNFGKISPWFSAVFGSISTALDLRALISSLRKSKKLDTLAKDAKEQNAEPELVAALEFAVQQKKKKAGRRGLSLFGNAASTTAGILGILGLFGVLATNPVGWAILALGAVGGAIALGMFLYRLIRSKIKQNKGKAREKHARQIWEGLQNRGGVSREVALAAVTSLGLKEEHVMKPRGWELIKDKLSSN